MERLSELIQRALSMHLHLSFLKNERSLTPEARKAPRWGESPHLPGEIKTIQEVVLIFDLWMSRP